MISKTKLYESFSVGQFLVRGYTAPYRKDRNSYSGSILLFVIYILLKLLSEENLPTYAFYVEISLQKKKCYFVVTIVIYR